MPLLKSISKRARESNIRELISAGHSPEQAEAIAYKTQRDAESKRRKNAKAYSK